MERAFHNIINWFKSLWLNPLHCEHEWADEQPFYMDGFTCLPKRCKKCEQVGECTIIAESELNFKQKLHSWESSH